MSLFSWKTANRHPVTPVLSERNGEVVSIEQQIANDPFMQSVSSGDRESLIRRTAELYRVARDVVGPVVTGFADSLLREAEGRKVIFAARDGIGSYMAAGKLLQKFEYPGMGPESIAYGYFSRRVVCGVGSAVLRQYVEQLGVNPDQGVLLADIGFGGSIISYLRQVMPNLEPRYIMSTNSSIPGYAHAEHGRFQMKSMNHIGGNPAVHFMEDTFSGMIASPGSLVSVGESLVPDTHLNAYPADVAIRRKYALLGVEDYAASITAPPDQSNLDAIAALDKFLSNTSNYEHLMVPHER